MHAETDTRYCGNKLWGMNSRDSAVTTITQGDIVSGSISIAGGGRAPTAVPIMANVGNLA